MSVVALVVRPSPSPKLLVPQVQTVPSSRRATECVEPVASCTACAEDCQPTTSTMRSVLPARLNTAKLPIGSELDEGRGGHRVAGSGVRLGRERTSADAVPDGEIGGGGGVDRREVDPRGVGHDRHTSVPVRLDGHGLARPHGASWRAGAVDGAGARSRVEQSSARRGDKVGSVGQPRHHVDENVGLAGEVEEGERAVERQLDEHRVHDGAAGRRVEVGDERPQDVAVPHRDVARGRAVQRGQGDDDRA